MSGGVCPFSNLLPPLDPGFGKILPYLSEKIQSIKSRISPLAIATLVKLGTAIAFNYVIMNYFTAPFCVPYTVEWLNRALLLSTVYAIPKVALDIYRRKQTEDVVTKGINHMAGVSIVNGVGLAGINLAIHEAGHVLTAWLCFKRPDITVNPKPYREWESEYSVSRGLTYFGRLLGKRKSILLTTIAGIFVSTGFGMTEFASAYHIRDRYPNLSQWMNYHAISQIFNEIVYGLVADRRNLSNDFVRLRRMGGIHPMIPIGLMIALPVAEIALFTFLEYRKRNV